MRTQTRTRMSKRRRSNNTSNKRTSTKGENNSKAVTKDDTDLYYDGAEKEGNANN